MELGLSMPYADIEKRRAYTREWRRKQRANGTLKEDYSHFHEMIKNYTPEQIAKKKLRRRVRTKVRAFLVLGGKCRMCGCTDFRLLTINHIHGITDVDKTSTGIRKSTEVLSTQIKNFKRDDLEILCYNCQILYEWERKKQNCSQEYQDMLRKELIDHKIQQDWF